MKKIFYLIGSLLLVLMVFSACKKSDIQKANDDYDFNSIKPGFVAISGPTATAASGLAPVSYQATPRGGSTWAWEVVGYGATITPGNPSFNVGITFDQSDADVNVWIIVTETTQGGIKSAPDSLAVALAKFKPMAFSEFIGDWAGVETDDGGTQYDVAFTVTGDIESTTITFPVDNGIPSLMSALFEGWGEAFQANFGNEGRVIMQIDTLTGAVTIGAQYWGQTLPGPYDYWILGSGTWEGFNKSMTFDYGMHWDESYSDDYNHSTMTITKQ